MEGSSVASRVLENLNNSFNRYSALNLSGRKEAKSKDIADNKSIDEKLSDYVGKHFNRCSALNLSGRRKEDKEVKSKMENMKTTLTKDINTIREAITSISSPHGYKRKHSNLINEDRKEIAAVDLTIDLCDTIKHDDDDEKVDIPTVKRRKLFKDGEKD